MKSAFLIVLNFLVLAISCLIVCGRSSFFALFKTIASNRLLHLLHSSFIASIILSLSSYSTNKILGHLTPSEFTMYNEKVYNVMGDLVMLISMFSHEVSVKSIIVFSILYSFKSFTWTLDIKSQKNPSYRIVYASAAVQTLTSAIIMHYLSSSTAISMLMILEYSLILLSLLKNQLIMLLDINNIENNRTLFVSIIKIVFLALKSLAFLMFILRFSVRNRFPYGIMKSLISTLLKLYKKSVLFKKYIKLLIDLESISEVDVKGTCAICTDDIIKGKKLQCSHVFHSSCLKMWCEREVSCPICRADLVFKREIIHETEDEIISGVPIEIEEATD
ncbi:uncharacterized protein VICG_01996 [Vittaforma corneae ATCC 50505]|uniref:RING-type domain-containing protein n=1 Tax=Vittaforma corneae (strain ATCC 50505) TaxID=993615 RepID=L2GJC3_VITCO|nr:uncharacterized protein VICG_01996 [Vittaforma corneae ATCC 50505]ELA40966.1 hypothetical protein VICG_01996 [Vittaforma corneae ATCC 50505]